MIPLPEQPPFPSPARMYRIRRLHDWLLAQPEPVPAPQIPRPKSQDVSTTYGDLRWLEQQDLVVRHHTPHPASGNMPAFAFTAVYRQPGELVPLRQAIQPAATHLLDWTMAADVARVCNIDSGNAARDLKAACVAGICERRLGGHGWRHVYRIRPEWA